MFLGMFRKQDMREFVRHKLIEQYKTGLDTDGVITDSTGLYLHTPVKNLDYFYRGYCVKNIAKCKAGVIARIYKESEMSENTLGSEYKLFIPMPYDWLNVFNVKEVT